MWNDVSKNPESHLIGRAQFSDDLLVKVKENNVKGFRYIVAYMNITDKVWFNPIDESEIKEEIIEWKYIDD